MAMLVTSESTTVRAIMVISRGLMSLTNLVRWIPTRSNMAPMILLGKRKKRVAMEPARKSPRLISMVPSMMLVPPVLAPK